MMLANFNEQPELFGFEYCIGSCSKTLHCGFYHSIKTVLGILIKHILRIFDSNGK